MIPLIFMGVAREFVPDLILLDIMMPELNGLQLCKMVRSDPKMKDISIIFLTAREVEDRVKGLEWEPTTMSPSPLIQKS